MWKNEKDRLVYLCERNKKKEAFYQYSRIYEQEDEKFRYSK